MFYLEPWIKKNVPPRRSRTRRRRRLTIFRAEELEPRSLLSNFIVNDPGSGTLDPTQPPGETSTGTITLESAIEQVNIDGSGSITFARSMMIFPGSALVVTASDVTIDGSDQHVVIEGLLDTSPDGLQIDGGDSTIENLVVTSFSAAGISINSSGNLVENDNVSDNALDGDSEDVDIDGPESDDNVLAGNSIGIVDGFGGFGIVIEGGSSGNTIGGTTADARNVVTNLEISGSGSSGNLVEGNDISVNDVVIGGAATDNTIGGTTAGARNVISGSLAIDDSGTSGNLVEGNDIGGVEIGGAATDNTIGGTTAGARNVIGSLAIDDSGTSGNLVEGNYIGIDASGSQASGSGGVDICDGATGNTIGGTTAGARNVITSTDIDQIVIQDSGTSGNLVEGNFIGTDASGTLPISSGPLPSIGGVEIELGATNNTIGGTTAGARNVIADGSGVSIASTGTSGNVVEGNFIGTDMTGESALGNLFGVRIVDGADGNTIGGTASGARNVISGNILVGVDIEGDDANSLDTSGNLVAGNFIGTDASGSQALSNLGGGVNLDNDASGNTIGGVTSSARNVISGNLADAMFNGDGVSLGSGATANVVEGNYIGTDASGTTALPNANDGVSISDDTGNTIGGTSPGQGNLISGNADFGVSLDDGQDSLVAGNEIGTDEAGALALGNEKSGIIDLDGADNTIGGLGAAAGNLISGNGGDGVSISSIQCVVEGNKIGTTADGDGSLGNAANGVVLTGNGVTIGGTVAGAGNIIANNGTGTFPPDVVVGVGVGVFSGSGNAILGNSIYSNSVIGIGILPAANNGQRPPVETSVENADSSITIEGTVQSTPDTTVRVEFFSNPSDSSILQGKSFLGFVNATTDGTGSGSFTFTAVAPASPVPIITATATDASGNSSTFSVLASQVTTTTVSPSVNPSNVGQNVTFTVTVTPNTGFAGVPAGTAQFFVDGTFLTPLSLSDGSASFSLSGLSLGTHAVTAIYDGADLFAKSTGALTQTVINHALVSIAVTPGDPVIAQGSTQQFTAIGTFSDGSTANLSSSVTWASAHLAVATINASGLATGLSTGASFITASLGTVFGGADLTVRAATVSSVSVSWGTAGSSALQTAADGLRLLPAGRNVNIPWLGINKIHITLSQSATLTSADIVVNSAAGINYGPVTISGSGANYVITLADPIDAADRITFTIRSPTVASFTRQLDVLPGDVNDDGIVTLQDALAVRNDYLGFAPVTIPVAFLELNGDGVVDVNDYNVVRRFIGAQLPPVV